MSQAEAKKKHVENNKTTETLDKREEIAALPSIDFAKPPTYEELMKIQWSILDTKHLEEREILCPYELNVAYEGEIRGYRFVVATLTGRKWDDNLRGMYYSSELNPSSYILLDCLYRKSSYYEVKCSQEALRKLFEYACESGKKRISLFLMLAMKS